MSAATKLDDLRETQQLLDLYDTAIDRQEQKLDKFKRGKFKSAQVDDEILYALIKGDLKLLQANKELYRQKKIRLENSKGSNKKKESSRKSDSDSD